MRFNPDDLIDINGRLGIPRTYRFNPELRLLTILFSFFVIAGCLWLIIFRIDMSTALWLRMVPFLFVFMSVTTLMTNLTALDSIRFKTDHIEFCTLLKKNRIIAWNQFRKMEFHRDRMKMIRITYETESGPATYDLTLTFTNILEIVNAIAELCPQIEYDQFMKNVIVGEVAKHIERPDHANS